MAKGSSVFVCNSCGAQFAKWQGKCPECGQWNTIEETLLQSYTPKVNNIANSRLNGFAGDISNGIVNLSNVSLKDLPRIHLGFQELDRVLGGGIVPGSVVLIGGNPGAGKSTLLLQMVSFLSVNNIKVLYITGEESLQQVALRAERLGLDTSKIRIATETSVDKIIFLAEKEKPQVMVIDSIQVMHVDGISSPTYFTFQQKYTLLLKYIFFLGKF